MKNTIRHDKKALKCHISVCKVAFFIIIFLFSVLFLSSNIKAENWYLKGGSSGLQNYSDVMNQGFYYQYFGNQSNLTSSYNTCSGNSYDWSSDGACTQPVFANRTDFDFFVDNGYLWWHPITSTTDGTLLKFVAPYSAEFYFNSSFYRWAGVSGNIHINVSKNGNTTLYSVQLSHTSQRSNYNSYINLTTGETLWFILTATPDGDSGDSTGIILNISSGLILTGGNISITINNPVNNSFTNLPGTFKGINFTYINPNTTQANCSLYVNNSLNNIINYVNSSQTTLINWTNNRSTGIWEYYIKCDAISETKNSEIRNLYIDLSPPTYSNFTNNATTSTPKFNQTASWNITLYDNFNISYYSLWHWSNGSLVLDSPTFLNGSFTGINISTIKNITAPKGYNVCGLYVLVDTAGNLNFTSTSCFLVRNTPPRVILDKPGNNSFINVNYATFNWTATDIDINDSNISQHNLWMSEDGGLTYNLKYNGGNPTILLNNLQSGILYWFVSSYDGTDWGNSSIFILNVRAPVLNITARDYLTNTSITSFTAILTAQNGSQIIKSTASKSIIFNLTYEVWNYSISASGYTDKEGTISMIDGNKNLTIYMQLPSTISVSIYYPNKTLANGILTSLLFISETQAYSVTYTTTNGTRYIPYIPADEYQLNYNASGYRNGVYYFNINTTTSASIKLNLISINDSSQIFITLYDINGNTLEGYIIKALRFDSGTNNWEFYQMAKTDDNGVALMYFIPFDNYYQFIVEKDGIVYLATPARLVYGDFSLIINPSRIDVLPMMTASNIAYNLSYDDSGNGFFRFQYDDLNSIVVRGCLNVKNPLSAQYLCSQCSNSTSAVLICNLNASNSSVLLAQGIITYLSDDYTIATLEKNFSTDYQTFGAGGIFYVALLVLALSLLALWHPIVAITMAIIAMILSGIIGLFYLTFTAGVVLVILGIVYMVLMRK